MKEKNLNGAHFCLTAVFIVGNTIINLPFDKGISGAIFGIIIAFVISIFLYALYIKIESNISGNSINNYLNSFYGKILGNIFTVFFALFAVFCAVACMRNYLIFNSTVILPESHEMLSSLIFITLIFLLSIANKSVIIKLSVLAFILSAAAQIILFFVALKQMDINNILPLIPQGVYDVSYQATSYLAISFAQGVVLIPFFAQYGKLKSKRVYKLGLVLGTLSLLLCLLHTVLVFGYSFALSQRFPYATAMSIISFGDTFSRMEGISYLIYFFCALIKSSVCIIAAKQLLKNISGKYAKYLPLALCGVLVMFSVFNLFFRQIAFDNIAPAFLIPAILLPVILIIPLLKNRTQCQCKTK